MRSRNLAGLLVVGAAALAACGGTSGYGSSPSAPAAPKSATPTTAVSVSRTQLGNVLVNASGRTLYGFTNDVKGVSTCAGTCARSWIPVAVAASWRPAPHVAGARLHTVPRADGGLQLAAGKWPLYTFTGDTAPGDVNGQGSLGKWFVVQPDGSLHKDDTTATATTAPTAPSMYGY
jgi:predicted lipoprotein with Yx(FWY)xxD motif